MIRCPACGAEVADGSRFCGSCGASLVAASEEPTRTSTPSRIPTALASPEGSSRSVATSSSAADQGRFLPGTVLAKRYRIIGLLGRGGMGEVYRADDLKLGQPVALKFLPREVERDEGRRARFLNEVRMALKVTHPNVTRVYDLGEVDGHHYISMEYVDGEDLSSLLRRIGRLPKDKAIQVGRQICAGLSAAHDQGVLHRDLKPANVMLDGRGQVKITDFGLAGLERTVEGSEARAGTPAYMAPEQWQGKEVTIQTDLYALGLMLYELFTGQSVFAGKSPAEIVEIQQQESSTITSPSTVIEGFDPAVERVILKCMEKEPAERPRSALAVSAALPGGDPLAAALAAGETPSPELVAQAGGTEGFSPKAAVGMLGAILIGLAVWLSLAPRIQIFGLAPLPKPPEVLIERARQIIAEIGYDREPRDSVFVFRANQDYIHHIAATDASPSRWERLRRPQPPAVEFRYRQSPTALVRGNPESFGMQMFDPPMTLPGMVRLDLDAEGRLRSLLAVPEPSGVRGDTVVPETNWSSLLHAAGFDPAELRSQAPDWRPPVFADERKAWSGSYPQDPGTEIRIEVASLEGVPVSFRLFEPWSEPVSEGVGQPPTAQRVSDLLTILFWSLSVAGAFLVALRNLRLGRGDRQTALRFALYMAAVRLVWLVGTHHVRGIDELVMIISHLARASWVFLSVWVFYIALEPYARRLWPHILITWMRLFQGQWWDPRVGRDVLIGTGFGVTTALLFWFQMWAIPRLVGSPGSFPMIFPEIFETLRGPRHMVANLAAIHLSYLLWEVLVILLLLVILRLIFRRTWIAVTILVLAQLLTRLPGEGQLAFAVIFVVTAVLYLWILFRVGFLSIAVGISVYRLIDLSPMSWDTSSWYYGATLLSVAIVLTVTAYGFRVSLAGRPLFRDRVLREPAP